MGKTEGELEAATTAALDQSRAERRGEIIATDPLLGTIFEGKYKIEKKIGEGGMGSVYRATHIFMERPVAIKFLHGDRIADAAAIERFKVEARAAGRLQHPHATAVTDFGVTKDNTFYLVMEYLEGRSLRERLKAEGALPLSEVVRIMAQVCDAVDTAHRRGIVHRDLKPDNIFLQRSDDGEVVKVLDFGIAKLTQGSSATAGLTSTGMIVGTPYYMSPEQCQGEQLDHRSDIYSLGVILFEMVTGKLPFTGDTPLSIVLKHVSEQPPSPRTINPKLPEPVEALILRALSKNKASRPQSAMQLAEELGKAVGLTVSIRHKTEVLDEAEGASQTHDLTPETKDSKLPRETMPISSSGADTNVIAEVETRVSVKKPEQKSAPAKGSGRRTSLIGSRPASGDQLDETAEFRGDRQIRTVPSRMPIYIGSAVVLLLLVGLVGYLVIRKPVKSADPLISDLPVEEKESTSGSDKSFIQMVGIPGGTFMMGRDPGKDPNFNREIRSSETPAHEVTVASFSISKYEITNAEYAEFIKATGYKPPPNWVGKEYPKGAADLPVVGITYADAVAFCEWLSQKEGRTYRLPTEEEWEFAARGPDSQLFPWGDTFEPNRANSKELGQTLLSVKSDSMKRDSSPYGVIGMAGNVSEWTSSDYKPYPGNTKDKPQPGVKVIRGGNCLSDNWATVATIRMPIPQNTPAESLPVAGFRVARDGVK